MPVLSGIDWFPLWLSLRVAILATAAALVAGTWMAYMLSHKQFRGKELLDSLITLPLVLPPTVLRVLRTCCSWAAITPRAHL